MDRYGEIRSRGNARGKNALLLGIGWISALLSLVFVPFVFGVLGVIMGILVTKNNNRSGLALIVGSIVLMGIGLIFSGVFYNYISHYLGL